MSTCVLVLLNRLPFPLGFHGAYHGGLHGAVSKTYTIWAWIFCVVPMGQAYVTYGATQGLPVLVYSESDFRLYTRIVLFAAGRDGLVSVTLNIVRNMDIFGMLSLTSYPKHLYSKSHNHKTISLFLLCSQSNTDWSLVKRRTFIFTIWILGEVCPNMWKFQALDGGNFHYDIGLSCRSYFLCA